MTTVFTTLKPYIKAAVAQNAKSGLPVMRPLFLHYEDDARLHAEIPVPVWPRPAGSAGS
jgi:alpha-glucosidase